MSWDLTKANVGKVFELLEGFSEWRMLGLSPPSLSLSVLTAIFQVNLG